MIINFDILSVSPRIQNEIDYSTLIFIIEGPKEFIMDNSNEYLSFFKILTDGGALKIYLKMQNVEYLDSSGIGVIINSTKHIRKNNGDLVLSNLTQEVKRIFDLVNLNKFIKVFNSEPEAINYFRYINNPD